jgi:hypothetical protein
MAAQAQPDRRAIVLIRKRTLLSLAIVTPLGFALKLYAGPGHRWVSNSAAGVLYELFWCLIVFFIWPRRHNATRIALSVLAATGLVEMSQLWHPWFLEKVRSAFLGKALIGTTFAWGDFPYYALGCVLGWLWIRSISRSPVDSETLPGVSCDSS